MNTIYTSGSKQTRRSTVEVAEKTFPDGKRFQVVLSNDPEVLDNIICRSIDTVDPDILLVVHTQYSSFTIDPEWQEQHPWSKNRPVGYVCRHCHEPVEVCFSQREADGPIHHVRYLCGCTMLLMSPEMGPWWRECNCAEMWNGAIVAGAKLAHQVHGVK
jgi:hypothetical protein